MQAAEALLDYLALLSHELADLAGLDDVVHHLHRLLHGGMSVSKRWISIALRGAQGPWGGGQKSVSSGSSASEERTA
jgi:hypothetical protein